MLAFAALLPALPVMAVILPISISVHRANPFFFQRRSGKNGKIFSIVKLRTMSEEKDKQGALLPDMKRITRFGSFLRKTSLDEIPNLWNVVCGDMSLVGPRPLLPEYLPSYSKEQNRRHDVLPGMTGWAQINGRNTISWKQRFEYDVWYVDQLSFGLDLKILMLTVLRIFKTKNVNASKNSTMDYFTGNN